MDEKISSDELLDTMLAPARRAPERSHALPTAAYRDPARIVQMESEKKGPNRAKKKAPKPNKKWR